MCSFFLFGECCMSIFSHCCGNSNICAKGKGGKKEQGKNRKQYFKAQLIWLCLPVSLRNASSFCLCACKGKQELKREVVPNCLLEAVGKSGSQNIWKPHQASSVRAQLPGSSAWDKCCNRAAVFSTTSLSLQGLQGSLTSPRLNSLPDASALGRLDQSWGWAVRTRDTCRNLRLIELDAEEYSTSHSLMQLLPTAPLLSCGWYLQGQTGVVQRLPRLDTGGQNRRAVIINISSSVCPDLLKCMWCLWAVHLLREFLIKAM